MLGDDRGLKFGINEEENPRGDPMKLDNIITEIIEPFSDPKEFFWCIELAKEGGYNTINLTFSCNNSVLTIELKIIPYYEVILGIIVHILSITEIKNLTDILTEIQYNRNWKVEIDTKGIHIHIYKNVKEALKYILVILEKRCNKSSITYTCNVGDE